VQAVGRRGARSGITRVSVRVVAPLPALEVGAPIAVGPGAGVPAAANGAVWVPTTDDGGLVEVAGGAVVSRTQVGPRSVTGEGYLDAAVAAGGSIWSASDVGSTIARVDPASGATSSIPVPERPGGLTAGGGAVYAFHFLQPTLTRIEEASGAARRIDVPGTAAVGLAYGDGSLWLLTLRPDRVLQLDPATGAIRRSIPLDPRLPRPGDLIDFWWLANGEGAVWATMPNYDAVARVDVETGAVRFVRLDHGRPFGIATGGGSAWVATDRALVRLDGATGRPVAAAAIPRPQESAFVSVGYGDGAAWVTTFDRGTLVRVDDPAG
jgi:streptogramin lyase